MLFEANVSWSWAIFLSGPPLDEQRLSLESVGQRTVVLRDALGSAHPPQALQVGLADGGITQPVYRQMVVCRKPEEKGSAPHLWVGDRDSLGEDGLERLEQGLRSGQIRAVDLPADKDLSDGAALLDEMRKCDCTPEDKPLVISVFGALGGRRDHEALFLAELVELFFVSNPRRGGTCLVLQPELVIADVALELRAWSGAADVSIRMLSRSGTLELSGFEYSGVVSLKRPTHGLSNRFRDSSGRIVPSGGAFYQVFLNL